MRLLGASGGWITDDTFFVGGAAYWLVNPSSDHEMWYGGLSLQWLAHTQSRFRCAAKGLIGGGRRRSAARRSSRSSIHGAGASSHPPR